MNTETILEQERNNQFDKFDNNTALEIGIRLLQVARERKLPIVIDITRCRHQIFHAALPGTSIDNDEWVRRKNNSVYRFEVSSLFLQLKVKKENSTIQEMYSVASTDYAAAGGAFPVRVKNTGFVGTITISGLTSEEDHNLIVEVLDELY